MNEGHKYFIENYLKIQNPDGSLGDITLRPHQIEFLKQLEEAQKKGLRLTIIKGRHRCGFEFVKALHNKRMKLSK